MAEKRKILYIITKSNFGGAQKYVLDLATAMKERDYEVAVALGGLSLATDAAQEREGLLKTKLVSSGIKTFTISSLGRDISVGKDAGSFLKIFSVIRKFKPDVVHLNSTKAGGLGALAARMAMVKKIVFTVHGWPFNENRNFFWKSAIWLASYVTSLLCTNVIVLALKELEQAKRMPFLNGKFKLIPNGIKPFEMFPRPEARLALNIPPEFFVIGSIGELTSNKNYQLLIETAAAIKDKKILFCVIGDGEEKKSLAKVIEEHRLSERVILTGFKPEAAKYLKAFDVFALPSIKEGLPYVLLEAGLASLPVVTTNVGGVPEIVENMKSGMLVQPKNHDELARVISFMIENPKERLAFGSALKAHVQEKFSFEKMVSLIQNLYSK